MHTALIVVAALATAVVVDLISGVLVRRVARGRYKWLLEPLRHACRNQLCGCCPCGPTNRAVTCLSGWLLLTIFFIRCHAARAGDPPSTPPRPPPPPAAAPLF